MSAESYWLNGVQKKVALKLKEAGKIKDANKIDSKTYALIKNIVKGEEAERDKRLLREAAERRRERDTNPLKTPPTFSPSGRRG